jgi:hypothetical protein
MIAKIPHIPQQSAKQLGCSLQFIPLKIILGLILERWDGVLWTELVWLRIETGGELF